MFRITTATKKIRQLSKRIRIVQGGSSASKTVSILMYLIDKAQRDKTPTLTSVVSESLPHLKQGAMLDFLTIMKSHNYYDDSRWFKSHPATYTFETGSKIEFFSIAEARKVRGPRRDRLFINEANNTPFESFEQLEIRTNEFIFLDYNPTTQFWVQESLFGKRDDLDFIILTYKDNEGLSETIVKSLEQRMNRKEWWKVYGLGQLGEVEGKIYRDWQIIDAIPHEARLERYGLDFGYSNDPTSVVAVYRHNGGYILDEILYKKEMLNRQIYDHMSNVPAALTIADSSEPKSIAEMRGYGLEIIGTEKGKDSVANGIQIVQSCRISVTKQSTNIIKEYRNYLWMVDKDGKILNVPEHEFSHGMDAVRYALSSIEKPFNSSVFKQQQNQFLINEGNQELNSTK